MLDIQKGYRVYRRETGREERRLALGQSSPTRMETHIPERERTTTTEARMKKHAYHTSSKRRGEPA